MDTPNLFLRIEGYAQENFITETLAYILENDPAVRKKFLDLFLNDRPKLRRAFRSCEIETQPRYDFGQPDLEIRSIGGRHAKLFVEVKTQSPEGELQIQRYLKGSHVAYLTPLGYEAPDLSGAGTKKTPPKYLGQFFWPEVYSVIRKYGSHNLLHKQFCEYLEARGMRPLPPISKDDLSASLHAADAIRKFQELVDAVRKGIQHDWKQNFGENIGGKGVSSGLATGELPYWWFRPRDWLRQNGRPYLAIGVWPDEGGPYFYVGLFTERKRFGNELRKNQKFQRLCKATRWRTAPLAPTGWECYKGFRIGTGKIDQIAQQQVKNIRAEGKKIGKLVTFLKKMQ